ncbi:MAG: UDP-N-acetylmuramate--L-alanine ligase, partial [Lachnospiraceae bacterium]|nr:UDP-N-acetylmuramate--L-alanine ligase [Lachnospiraceae bacterium]
MKDKLKIHFIGIGGSSMNGLALIMKNKGHEVSGSDVAESPYTRYLESKGIKVIIGQSRENITDPDLVIHTAAISNTNAELMEAKRKNIETMDRASFLGKLTKEYKTAIGVAGCHGKTTITSMIGLIAIDSGVNPTVHIGASVPFFDGGGTHIGNGNVFIVEACEYENSYHQFSLSTAVINNIDNDHLNFFGNIDNIVKSFEAFALKLPPNGLLVANADDDRVMEIADKVCCNVASYGLSNKGQWQARNIVHHNIGATEFDVYKDGEKLSKCRLNIAGKHNIQNALAAIIVCDSLGIAPKES